MYSDDTTTPEKAQTKRQHSAPEYLERRKHEKDRRKAESTLKARLRKARKTDPISPKEVRQAQLSPFIYIRPTPEFNNENRAHFPVTYGM
jgi:hypothetical protein